VVELRIIFRNKKIFSGYFDDFAILAEIASEFDRNAGVAGVYWTLNPIKTDCLHRAKNHAIDLSKDKSGVTTDTDILERRLILLDFDAANRPTGISANQAELDAAREKASQVMGFLSGKGWEAPIAAMSGNGYHLLYRTHLPNDDGSREGVKRLLEALAGTFNDTMTKIDTSVFNISRICKVYGTVARKGDNTDERPHRRSMLFETAR
jgi:uncharacterized alpha-E superfamily protein